ncbi:SAM-dependent methyltransferase [Actinophytocola gossypii]|uniref:Class I SAM-dependent methyltransferase n=1 Tax=Actinophytocola gossypii TaxID=2812003 RepID=A0ABT2J8M7_9PSEU|nr:cyclopropane-fatty-acyl-phospholipid synthase family protein [Actinophytocola gossypii]MCT2584217.1 class I SAM-dependent methyltransferase [Actinophytocola gossypii]
MTATTPRPDTSVELRAPYSPARAWAAERLFRLAARRLPVRVRLPGGEVLGRGGPDAPTMTVRRPEFFHRLGVRANIGFGEAYMAGDWTSPDPAAVLTPFAARMARLVPRPLQVLRRFVDAARPAAERNTPEGARANIHRHYNLSNDLFAAFLDESMTYSSAWFRPGDDLHAAQLRKIDGILDYAGVRAGSRVLEIGTGWGALAIRAARRGAHVTTLTISTEQRDLALAQVAEAGVADRVDVRLCDYRDATGRYDAVVSVEMIEAVGEEFWPAYFATLDRLVEPAGRVALQAITLPHDRMLATLRSHNWIHEYVFPGGMLLSVPAIEQQVSAHTGLAITARRSLGEHYARTLRCWRDRFLAADVAAIGFDETFRRLWEFYLAYSEAGFASGYLDVWQLRMARAR